MKIKRIIRLGSFLMALTIHAFGQPASNLADSLKLNQCMDRVDEVNSLTLTKVHLNAYWLDRANEENGWKFDNEGGFFDDHSWYVYIDRQGRIRKYTETDWCEYVSKVNVHYYDQAGNLCYIIQRENVSEESEEDSFDYNGYAYMLKGNVVFAELKYVDKERPEKSYEQIVRNGRVADLPKEADLPLTTKILMERFGLPYSGIDLPQGCPRVRFVTDYKGSGEDALTLTNRNNIKVYAGPGVKYPVLSELNAGYWKRIGRTDRKEEIPGLGAHHWYEVLPGEYIFGAFLEPVEIVIE